MNSFFGPRRPGGPEKVSFGRIPIEAGHVAFTLSPLMTLLGLTLFTSNDLKSGV